MELQRHRYKRVDSSPMILAAFCTPLLATLAGCSDSHTQSEEDQTDVWVETISAEDLSNDAFMPPLRDDVSAVIFKSDFFELFSLDPGVEKDSTDLESFHGWRVLGTAIIDTNMDEKMLKLIVTSIPGEQGMPACFNPRHGLRFTTSESIIDILICFECSRLYVFQSEKPDSKSIFSSTITNKARGPLNDALTEAGVTLPNRAPD